jgi:exopolysaccharide biosynthesis polyprenyl glycosylphosphotransferase
VALLYIFDLYDINKFISSSSLEMQLVRTMVSAGAFSIFIFYVLPFFSIAPKTNLVLNIALATLMLWLWRKLFFLYVSRGEKVSVLFLGDGKEVDEIIGYLNTRPQLGYKTLGTLKKERIKSELPNKIENQNIEILVVSEEVRIDKDLVAMLYSILPRGITVVGLDKFYESTTGKIPVYQISKSWFLENLIEINRQSFEKTKESIDTVLGILLLPLVILLYPIIGLAIKLSSSGPVLYKQKRVGKNGEIFELLKFRSMIKNAEKNGAQWAKEDDARVTFVGNFLRKTRIDELPQIWNVIKGDLSFVGPRPERPEFVEELKEKIPFYSARLLVKPGLSGWAQTNFPYGASVEDATEKMQYDLYYIKNRSLFLDLVIALKTIAIILRRQGR